MAVFTGAGVAIVTPMNDNGEVNYDEFAKIIDFQVENGTDAIIVCGTTGEASTLTHEEHLEAIRFCVEKVNKRIPVIAGTGSNCTETAIYLSKEAEKYGVDGLLVVTPYYNKATQKGLLAHYDKVLEHVNLPIILYNVPSRTGCNIKPETLKKLSEVENIFHFPVRIHKPSQGCAGAQHSPKEQQHKADRQRDFFVSVMHPLPPSACASRGTEAR